MAGQYDLGTARGKVVVDYQSTNAKKVQDELKSVQDTVNKSNHQWVAAAAQYGAGVPQIQKYIQVQRAVADASKTAAFFEANLASARKRSGTGALETVRAEMMAVKARKSLADMTKVLATVQGNMPAAMAGQGSAAAEAFTSSFLTNTSRKLGSGGRGGGLSGILATAAAGATKAVVTGGVLAAAAVATAGIAAVGYAASKGMQRTIAIDQTETKMRALGHTAQEVTSIMNSANEAVLKTSFSLDSAATVAAQAIGAKIKPGADLTKYLKEVADAAAIAEVPLETMGDIFSRIQASQRVYTEDLMMMSRQGIPIWQDLAKEYGVSEAKLRKMVENSAVDAKTFRKVLAEEIGGSAAKMGESIAGSMQNLNAAISRVGGSALAPLKKVIPAAINGLIEKLNQLNNWLQTHQRSVAEFFLTLAKVGVGALRQINNFLATTFDTLSDFADLLSGIIKPLEYVNRVGANLGLNSGKEADDLKAAIEWLDKFSKSTDKTSKSLENNNKTFDDWLRNADEWVKQFENGKVASDELAESAGGTTEAVATLEEQLEKLNLTEENVVEAVQGTNAEFQKFLKTLKDKRASDSFINQVIAMRNAFNRAGPGARDLARALDLLADKSADAGAKTDALIKSLRTIGLLPGDDSLANFNQTMQDLTDYTKIGVDTLSKFGNELVNVDNTINTTSVNGQTLWKKLQDAQQAAFNAAASGQKSPAEAWQETHDALLLVLSDFHITGQQAEAIIENYLLPKHSFEVQFTQRGGDELRKELTSLFNQIDAAKKHGENKVDFRVEVTGDKEELRKQIESLGGSIVFDPMGPGATVNLPPSAELDDARKRLEEEWKQNTEPLDVPGRVSVPNQASELVDEATGGKPLELPAEIKLIGDVGGSIKKQINNGEPIQIPLDIGGVGGTVPPEAPAAPGIGQSGGTGGKPVPAPAPFIPGLTNMLPGTAGQGYFNSEAASRALDLATAAASDEGLAATAREQGRNFAESFAQGILDALQQVNDAALELAKKASEPLGQSPAPYGPLSGSGWTYNRGKNFSHAFAAGIVSGTGTVNRASLSLASGSTGTLQESIGIFLKDYGEFTDFLKHSFDFVSSLGDIAFNVLTLANQVSGGRLFPKTYVKDASRTLERQRRLDREQKRREIAGQAPTVGGAANFSANVTPRVPSNPNNKKEAAQFIYQSALARGYTPQQAKAILAYGIGESGLNPSVSPGVQTPGLGPVGGIFQMTPEFARANGISPEERLTLEGNVKAYLNALEANRNKPIDAFGVGKGALPSTSVGGPLTPEGRQPWGPLLEQAQAYIDQFGSGSLQNFAPRGIVSPSALRSALPGRSMTYTKAAVRNMGIPMLYAPGEYSYSKGGGGLPDWAYALGNKFNLQTGSSISASGVDSLHGAGNAFDFSGAPADMERLAQYLMNDPAMKSQLLQLIYRGSKDYEVAGGQTAPGYYSASLPGHTDHVHAGFAAPVGFGPGMRNYGPVPITLPASTTQSLDAIDKNTDSTNSLGLPPLVEEMANNDVLLRQIVEATRSGNVSSEQATPWLQHLDGLIADQNALATVQGKETADYLGGIRDNVMNMAGVTEGPGTLDQAQNIAQGTVGLAQDVFSIIQSTIDSVAAANDISNTLARGIANSEDIYKVVDSVQSFIKLAQDIASTVGDGLAFAAGIVGAGSAGDPSGGGAATSMALGAASSISQIVSSVMSAVNAGIDLVQEAYRIGTKYLGRFMLDWAGLAGATDAKYLLDTISGEMLAYTSNNPENKTVFKTLTNELFGQENFPGRTGPENNFYIYQGPGQDPRDTMTNAMFAIKSSSVGAFGYES